MARISLLAAALLSLCIGLPAQAQAFKRANVSKLNPQAGEEVVLTIEPQAEAVDCGVQLNINGAPLRDMRIEAGKINEARFSFPADGVYTLQMRGKALMRGLRSVGPCEGNLPAARFQVGRSAEVVDAAPPAPSPVPAPAPAPVPVPPPRAQDGVPAVTAANPAVPVPGSQELRGGISASRRAAAVGGTAPVVAPPAPAPAPAAPPAPPQVPTMHADPKAFDLVLFINPKEFERQRRTSLVRAIDGSPRIQVDKAHLDWGFSVFSREEQFVAQRMLEQLGPQGMVTLFGALDRTLRVSHTFGNLTPALNEPRQISSPRSYASGCNIEEFNLCERGVMAVFRANLPQVQRFVDQGRWVALAQLDTARALGSIFAQRAETIGAASTAAARGASNLEQLRTQPSKLVAGIVTFPNQPGGPQANRTPAVCAANADAATTAAFRGYLAQAELKKLFSDQRLSVTKTDRDADALYTSMQSGQCNIAMMTGAQALDIWRANERDRKFTLLLLDPKSPAELGDAIATTQGFDNAAQAALAQAIGARPGHMGVLHANGVRSPAEFQAVGERMVKSGYAGSVSASDVVAFLNDEAEGKPQGRSAVQVKRARDEAQARQEREAEQAKARAAEAHAKEFPYIAVLSCGMPGHINILACFAGENSSAGATELELDNGQGVKVYKVFNMGSVGREQRDGLHIDLRRGFRIQAQNAHSTLVLGLKIIERSSGKVLYQAQAGHFKVLRAPS